MATGNSPMIATMAKEMIARDKATSTRENAPGNRAKLDLIEHWSQ
jgi:hypothetical protein